MKLPVLAFECFAGMTVPFIVAFKIRESNLCVDKVGVFNAEEAGVSFHQCVLRTDEAKH